MRALPGWAPSSLDGPSRLQPRKELSTCPRGKVSGKAGKKKRSTSSRTKASTSVSHEISPSPGTVTFVGSLEFPPNIDGITFFAREVWPLIRRRGGGRRLLVVGRRPVAEVRSLTEIDGVELHPDVPDVRPYVREASVVIVPTRKGGGLKNKILEACAMRRAVSSARY